jgi:hypothetical protein
MNPDNARKDYRLPPIPGEDIGVWRNYGGATNWRGKPKARFIPAEIPPEPTQRTWQGYFASAASGAVAAPVGFNLLRMSAKNSARLELQSAKQNYSLSHVPQSTYDAAYGSTFYGPRTTAGMALGGALLLTMAYRALKR